MSFSIVSIAFIIVLSVYQIYVYVTRKSPSGTISPPGPPRLPVWGSYWFLVWGNFEFPHKTIPYYIDKYKSKLLSLYMGSGRSSYTVVLNDYATIKQALTRKEFDGRLGAGYVAKARAFGKQLGIFFNDDDEWLVQRRFALRTLRDFGFGRRHPKFESFIADQLTVLVKELIISEQRELSNSSTPGQSAPAVHQAGGLAYFPDVLFASCANPIWFLMSGESYETEDHEILRKLCRSAMKFQRNSDTTGGALSQTPWLRYFGGWSIGFKAFMEGNYAMADFAKTFLDKRRREKEEYSSAGLPDNENNSEQARGFVDAYMDKMREEEKKRYTAAGNETATSADYSFSEKQLLIVMVDLMFPALSAVPSMLTHIIKRLMHNPDVMKKVQREIDEVVGASRLPQWNDRIDLPYTEATIREGMRIDTLTPWSVAHRATERTTLLGYDIPIDTSVVTNLDAMHNDPDLWGDPENFRPERFLTPDGRRLAIANDWSLPFGLGRRVCAGETFARFLIFAHIAALAQNFDFHFVHGQPTKLEDVLPGLIVTPRETWIRLSSRQL